MKHEEIEEAYRRYGHLVLRRCRRILKDDAAAEDALQEVFLRLWRYGEAYLIADSKVSWLYRVADRCCFDQLARRRSRPEAPLEPGHERASDGPLPGQALEDRDVLLRF